MNEPMSGAPRREAERLPQVRAVLNGVMTGPYRLHLAIIFVSLSTTPMVSGIKRFISERAELGGYSLVALRPPQDWSAHPATLVIAVATGCPHCERSLPFYSSLLQMRREGKLKANILFLVQTGKSPAVRQPIPIDTPPALIVNNVELSALGIPGTPTILTVDGRGKILHAWKGELSDAGRRSVLDAAVQR